MNDANRQSVIFQDLEEKPVHIAFDEPMTSSDGGAILLKSVDARVGLTQRLAECFADPRAPGKVSHTIEEMLRQRVFGLACGDSDTNDAARLAEDPVHKMIVGRDPVDGANLASQPTLCRLENNARSVDFTAWEGLSRIR
ncbi:MAG: transposase [Acidobacteriota bacterium]|nr:transposase [Acidobacteriota bacterium]MDQ7088465.1 transposase [Acidobacteriota bacterium]